MSLLSETSGTTFDIDSDEIYTGARTVLLYSPPSGKRVLISDVIVSAQDNGIYLLRLGETEATSRVVRRMFLEDSGGWVENRKKPIEGTENQKIYFQIITASASATIGLSGEAI